MKNLALRVIVSTMFIGLCPGSGIAASGVSIDGTISRSTDPYSDASSGFGPTTGYGIGASKTLSDISEKTKLAIRADISYYKWSENDRYLEWSLVRLPLFAGFRVYRKTGSLEIYGEGGFELSFDKWESFYTGPLYGIQSPGQRSTYSDRKFGLAPGAGVEIPVVDDILIGIHARYHLMDNSYSTFGLSVGYRF